MAKLNNIPFFIGYPRSGNHWIKGVTLEYFGKKKIVYNPNIIYKDIGKEVLFFGGHDLCVKSYHRVLYLCRDPGSVIFSLLKVKGRLDSRSVISEARKIRFHREKFFNHGSIIICYENFIQNFADEFKKVADFFGYQNIDNDRLKKVLLNYTKSSIVRRNNSIWTKSELLSKAYSDERKKFLDKYRSVIAQHIGGL